VISEICFRITETLIQCSSHNLTNKYNTASTDFKEGSKCWVFTCVRLDKLLLWGHY